MSGEFELNYQTFTNPNKSEFEKLSSSIENNGHVLVEEGDLRKMIFDINHKTNQIQAFQKFFDEMKKKADEKKKKKMVQIGSLSRSFLNDIPSTHEVMEKNRVEYMRERFREWGRKDEKNDGKIIHKSLVGSGCFGSCYLAIFPFGHEAEVSQCVVKYYIEIGMSQSSDLFGTKSLVGKELVYHKNIVQILYYDSDWETSFDGFGNLKGNCPTKFGRGILVTEHFDCSLLGYLKKRKKNSQLLSNWEICTIMRGILDACEFLSKNFIVHRDIHIENIFVRIGQDYSRVVVGDFGSCLNFGRRKGALKNSFKVSKGDLDYDLLMMNSFSNLTKSILVGGYEKFLPPEVRNFDGKSDTVINYEKCDLFSAGSILEMMLDYVDICEKEKGEFKGLQELFKDMTKDFEDRCDIQCAIKKMDELKKTCNLFVE